MQSLKIMSLALKIKSLVEMQENKVQIQKVMERIKINFLL